MKRRSRRLSRGAWRRGVGQTTTQNDHPNADGLRCARHGTEKQSLIQTCRLFSRKSSNFLMSSVRFSSWNLTRTKAGARQQIPASSSPRAARQSRSAGGGPARCFSPPCAVRSVSSRKHGCLELLYWTDARTSRVGFSFQLLK